MRSLKYDRTLSSTHAPLSLTTTPKTPVKARNRIWRLLNADVNNQEIKKQNTNLKRQTQ